MEKKDIVSEKISLLKDEIKILNDRIHSVLSSLWKVRQISLTLWLAAVSIGLGAISKGNKPLFNVLSISLLIPVIFHYIDARLTRWYNIFKLRDSEIQRFLSNTEYFLPSNHKRMIFTKSLEQDDFVFPVYDIHGEETFGDNEYYLWRKKLFTCLLADTPLFFYGIQYITATFLISLELRNKYSFEYWWLLAGIVPVTLVILSLKHTKQSKSFLTSENIAYSKVNSADAKSRTAD